MAIVNKEMMQTIQSLTAEVREQKARIDTLYRTQEAMRRFILSATGVDPLATPADNSDSQMDVDMDRVTKEFSGTPADSNPANNGPVEGTPAVSPPVSVILCRRMGQH